MKYGVPFESEAFLSRQDGRSPSVYVLEDSGEMLPSFQHLANCIFFLSFLRFSDKVGFSPVSQALGSRSHPGAVPQEKREEGDGGKRDSGYQETLGQNGLQRPPQFQDHGKGGALLHNNV